MITSPDQLSAVQLKDVLKYADSPDGCGAKACEHCSLGRRLVEYQSDHECCVIDNEEYRRGGIMLSTLANRACIRLKKLYKLMKIKEILQ